MTTGSGRRGEGDSTAILQGVVWAGHMVLPLALLAILLAAPEVDATWKHNPSHFWLVAIVALANVAVGLRVTAEARDHTDARLFLVGYGFLASAAFFAVHALVTPAVIASESTAGFQLAMPTGLVVFGALGAWSGRHWDAETARRLLARQNVFRNTVIGVAVVWVFLSVNQLPPLDQPLDSDMFDAVALPLTAVVVLLFGVMAWRYWRLHQLRPSAVSLAMVTAATLLAETMVIVAVSRTWQLSWWLWHVVVLLAYGYVAYAAYITFRRDGRAGGLFTAVGMDATVEQVRVELQAALEELVGSMAETGRSAEGAARVLGRRMQLTESQTQILAGAAETISSERLHAKMHAAMADLARHGLREVTEEDLAERSEAILARVFQTEVRCGLVRDGRLVHAGSADWPAIDLDQLKRHEVTVFASGRGDVVACPVVQDDEIAGDIEILRPLVWHADADDLVRLFAGRLALSYENVRLYRQVRQLFSSYVPQEVAKRLLADPSRAALGGAVVETTVLFADLRGFTSYSEDIGDPTAIVSLLNDYYSVAVPIILDEGGTVDKFVGDALMALFNTPVLQPDHALRAVRAAHRIHQAIAALASDHPDWPRFRIGVNTGPALVGNIGSKEVRNFTAIGDAVNVAARLETAAEPGQVLIGATTQALVHHAVRTRPVGRLQIKGRAEPVEAFLVESVTSGEPS